MYGSGYVNFLVVVIFVSKSTTVTLPIEFFNIKSLSLATGQTAPVVE